VNIIEVMDEFSIWGIFFMLIATILVSTQLGFLLGKHLEKSNSGAINIRTGAVVSATLGLLAFMLAFTFGTVTSRDNERKHLVLDEANAIGTAYLRADLLPDADREAVQRILNHYLMLRIAAVQAGIADELEHLTQAKKLQRELWSLGVEISHRESTPITALFLQSLNEVFDMHTKRITVGIHHRMRPIFWMVLFSLTVLTMLVGGYDSAMNDSRRSITVSLSVSLAFALTLLLVIALDRPSHNVTQGALIDLQQDLRKNN
jgi:hypothetical protein